MKQLYKNYNQSYQEFKKEAKRINIFLTQDQYKAIYVIKKKYQLGLSVIAQIVFDKFYFNKELQEAIQNQKLYKTTYKKSSIKIHFTLENKEEIKKASCVNNALIIFLNHMEGMYTSNKEQEAIRNEIYNLFQNTIDPFYNYNENMRQFVFIQECIYK